MRTRKRGKCGKCGWLALMWLALGDPHEPGSTCSNVSGEKKGSSIYHNHQLTKKIKEHRGSFAAEESEDGDSTKNTGVLLQMKKVKIVNYYAIVILLRPQSLRGKMPAKPGKLVCQRRGAAIANDSAIADLLRIVNLQWRMFLVLRHK